MMSDCLFCRIIQKQIPAKFEYENETLVVIQDINPQAPTHLLLIPKQHIAQLNDADVSDARLIGELILCAKELAQKKRITDGYRLVFNNGAKAGQSVFHVHLHLLGGRIMTWPPG